MISRIIKERGEDQKEGERDECLVFYPLLNSFGMGGSFDAVHNDFLARQNKGINSPSLTYLLYDRALIQSMAASLQDSCMKK